MIIRDQEFRVSVRCEHDNDDGSYVLSTCVNHNTGGYVYKSYASSKTLGFTDIDSWVAFQAPRDIDHVFRKLYGLPYGR